jgi:hypothetical protein
VLKLTYIRKRVRNGIICAVIDGGQLCDEQALTVAARSAPAELIWLNRDRTDLITTPADRRPFWHSVTLTTLTAAGGRKDERAALEAKKPVPRTDD